MSELAPNYIRLAMHAEVKASNKEALEVAHLISTPSVDRAGDVVDPSGADIANYMRNPVVLRNHSYDTEDIVGKATSIEITKDGVWARTKFRDNYIGRDAYKLVAEGIGGWSIGFRPIEYEAIKDDKGHTKGFNFKRWELLEYSLVAVPMNQDIVNNCVRRGLVAPENVSKFFVVEQAATAKPDTSADPGPKAEPKKSAPHPALADMLSDWDDQCETSRRLEGIDNALRLLNQGGHDGR